MARQPFVRGPQGPKHLLTQLEHGADFVTDIATTTFFVHKSMCELGSDAFEQIRQWRRPIWCPERRCSCVDAAACASTSASTSTSTSTSARDGSWRRVVVAVVPTTGNRQVQHEHDVEEANFGRRA